MSRGRRSKGLRHTISGHVLNHSGVEANKRCAGVDHDGGRTESTGCGDDSAVLDPPPSLLERPTQRDVQSGRQAQRLDRFRKRKKQHIPYEPATWAGLVDVENDARLGSVKASMHGTHELEDDVRRAVHVWHPLDFTELGIDEHATLGERDGEPRDDDATDANQGADGMDEAPVPELLDDDKREDFSRVVAGRDRNLVLESSVAPEPSDDDVHNGGHVVEEDWHGWRRYACVKCETKVGLEDRKGGEEGNQTRVW